MSESLADRVAARRQERVQKRSAKFVLTIPGFRDLLAVRYQTLTFEKRREIQLRHEGIGENADDEVAAAADLLINACVEVLEVTGKDDVGNPTFETVAAGWTPDLIRSTFGTEYVGNSTRQALIEALGSTEVMDHFGEYIQEADAILSDGEEAAQGEAQPSVEG
jgi:hypothetical protein